MQTSFRLNIIKLLLGVIWKYSASLAAEYFHIAPSNNSSSDEIVCNELAICSLWWFFSESVSLLYLGRSGEVIQKPWLELFYEFLLSLEWKVTLSSMKRLISIWLLLRIRMVQRLMKCRSLVIVWSTPVKFHATAASPPSRASASPWN